MKDRKAIFAALAALAMPIDATNESKPAPRSPYQRRSGVKHGRKAKRGACGGEPKPWWETPGASGKETK